MQIKSLLCAAALFGVAAAVQAEDISVNVPLLPDASNPGNYSAGVGLTHLAAGVFTDTLTFVGATGGFVSASFVTIGFSDSNDIDFTSVTIDGQTFNLIGDDVEVATFETAAVDGPLVVTVQGIAGPGLSDGTSIAASYAGTLNVSPIPEPGMGAMLLAGLGVISLLGRRMKA